MNRAIMYYANANKIQEALIALDQEKAFDRVDWSFLFKALQHFRYGPKIIQQIKTVYQNIETQIEVNRHLPQAFLPRTFIVTNNQILVVKIKKIRPPPAY